MQPAPPPELVKSTMISSSTLPHDRMRRLGLALMLPATLVSAIAVATPWQSAKSQTPGDSRALSIRADVQEANAKTGVLTARGNVQIYYPARQIQATAAQGQYFSRERRIVLSGNVYVLQQGNSIRGETVTYLIDEGRFIVLPQANKQVESIYVVASPNSSTQSPTAPATPPLNSKPPASTAPVKTPANPGR